MLDGDDHFYHYYLQFTSLFLLLPALYFFFNGQNARDKPWFEYILVALIVIIVTFSQFFWNHPTKHSPIHKMDAMTAKISFVLFSGYIILRKFKFSFLPFVSIIFTCFYLSDFYSSREWCSEKHLIWHALFHFFCACAAFYAFIPVRPAS